MQKRKNILIAGAALIILVGALYIVFFIDSLISDEYDEIRIRYDNSTIALTTEPDNLLARTGGRDRDILVIFRNESLYECTVALRSASNTESFQLESAAEYGMLLPDGDNFTVSFCDAQKNFRFH